MLKWKRDLALPVTLVAIAMGFLISLQVQTQQNVSAAEKINAQRLQPMKTVLANAQTENSKLKEEHKQLSSQLDQLRQKGGTDPALLDQLDQIEIMDGTQKVQGPGIQIMIDDRQQEHKVVFPVTPDELGSIVNTLRFAGAEAISINDQRIVGTTAIVLSGNSTILVNQVPINRVEGIPYEIDAIGNQETLYDYISKLDAEVLTQNGDTVSITQKNVTIPSYKGTYTFKEAKPVAAP